MTRPPPDAATPPEPVDPREADALREAARFALAYHDFAAFTREFWQEVDPRPFARNWHHDVVCAEIQRLFEVGGELVINVPPGSAKSLIASVLAPAWLWLRRPEANVLSTSHVDDLPIRDGRRMRRLLASPRYQALADAAAAHEGRPPWRVDASKSAEKWLEVAIGRALVDPSIVEPVTPGGARHNRGIREGVTGLRADVLIVDDPYDAKAALLGSPEQVAARMREVVDVYGEALETRLDDTWSARLVIMQRLHVDDLAGARIRAGARRVVLPQRFDPKLEAVLDGGRRVSLVHRRDPRQEAGELLHPARVDEERDAALREALGATGYATQYGQRPTIRGGALLRRALVRRFDADPLRLAVDEIVVYADLATKGPTVHRGRLSDPSWNVAHVWGRRGADAYLLDRWAAQCAFSSTLDGLRDLFVRWKGRVLRWYVEDKANGPAAVDLLRAEIPGLVEASPGTASKYERAQVAIEPLLDAGRIWFPSPAWSPWADEVLDTWEAFPLGGHDDDVDAASGALGVLFLGRRVTSARLRQHDRAFGVAHR